MGGQQRPAAIDIVEIEVRRPGIDQLSVAADLTAELGRGVERHIVVDELPEEGVAGGGVCIAGWIAGLALLDHGAAQRL